MRRKSTIERKLWDLRGQQADCERENDVTRRDRLIWMIVALEWAIGKDPYVNNFRFVDGNPN
ncbi:MAG TPA: hypothetical protein V6D22_17045 [Candidatus Obscuribacterales bacterium]